MATRKQKHAAAVAKHEKYMQELHMDNEKWLKQAQTQRTEERQAAEDRRKERKVATSKRLAKAHRAKPMPPQGGLTA